MGYMILRGDTMKKVLFLSMICSILLTGCFTSTSTGDSTIVTSESEQVTTVASAFSETSESMATQEENSTELQTNSSSESTSTTSNTTTSITTTTQTSKQETKNEQTQVSQTEATKTQATQTQTNTSESQTSLTQTETESSTVTTTNIPTTTSVPMGKVTLEAYQFGYNPQVVTIKLGQPTEFTFIARDVAHGFKNGSLGIDVQVEPGSPVKLIVTPDEAKDYEIKCHVFCGSGHRDMEAIIRVVP